MPPVGAAVAVGVLGLAAGSTAAFVVGTAVSLGLSLGLSYAANAIFAPEAPDAAQINSPESRGSVKQAIPAQRIVFGNTRFGGAFYFYKAVAPYLYIGLMHSILPITSYDQLFIGETEVAIDTTGNPNSLPYFLGGSSKLLVATQDGSTVAQASNPTIVSDFSLGADWRLPSTANTVFRFDYGTDFTEHQDLWGTGQIPVAEWVGKGTPIYDPRNPTHVLPSDMRDPDELAAALATWDYTNNAALIQAFWAMSPFGFDAGTSNIRWDEVAEAADFDDESVPLKNGGVQKRHTIDGVVLLNQKPLVVMERMLTANRGFVVSRAGGIRISSSQPRDAIATITDNDLIGGFTYRDDQPKRDLANTVTVKFVSPDANHQSIDGPITVRSDLLTADGEPLEIDVRLPMTTTHMRAQRIVKAELENSRIGKTINPSCTMRLFGVVEGDIVRVWSETFPEMNGFYQVLEWSEIGTSEGIQFSLGEYDKLISRNWNAQTDEQDFEVAA